MNPGVKSCSRKLRRLTSITRLPARPPDSTSISRSGSTPAFEASTSASLTASIVTATRIWLQALAVWPAPAWPSRTIVLPITSNSGRARSNASEGPPTMIDSVPSRAPTSPPDTGASNAVAPSSDAASKTALATAGAIELMSIRS